MKIWVEIWLWCFGSHHGLEGRRIGRIIGNRESLQKHGLIGGTGIIVASTNLTYFFSLNLIFYFNYIFLGNIILYELYNWPNLFLKCIFK